MNVLEMLDVGVFKYSDYKPCVLKSPNLSEEESYDMEVYSCQVVYENLNVGAYFNEDFSSVISPAVAYLKAKNAFESFLLTFEQNCVEIDV